MGTNHACIASLSAKKTDFKFKSIPSGGHQCHAMMACRPKKTDFKFKSIPSSRHHSRFAGQKGLLQAIPSSHAVLDLSAVSHAVLDLSAVSHAVLDLSAVVMQRSGFEGRSLAVLDLSALLMQCWICWPWSCSAGFC